MKLDMIDFFKTYNFDNKKINKIYDTYWTSKLPTG